MTHWAAKYIGKKWTEESDCGFWFRQIQQIEFGRIVPPICVNHAVTVPTLQYAEAIKDDKINAIGWQRTEIPKEGDAVFLAQRNRPHHVGTVVFVGEKFYVLHAVKYSGLVASDKASLAANGWKIKSFWQHVEE